MNSMIEEFGEEKMSASESYLLLFKYLSRLFLRVRSWEALANTKLSADWAFPSSGWVTNVNECLMAWLM